MIYSGSVSSTQPITASGFFTAGNITAQTLVVSTISSSVEYSSGSNIFGNSTANTQTFTGSLNISGSAINANVSNACFAGQICAPGGVFTLSTTNGGFKVTGVSATPPNLAYLANNYFAKFYTRPDQNYGIAIFDQSCTTAIQSADLVNGCAAQSLVLNPYGGNVGIGTSTPQTKFAISNNLQIALTTIEYSLTAEVEECTIR
jgi:hypothetical protein